MLALRVSRKATSSDGFEQSESILEIEILEFPVSLSSVPRKVMTVHFDHNVGKIFSVLFPLVYPEEISFLVGGSGRVAVGS